MTLVERLVTEGLLCLKDGAYGRAAEVFARAARLSPHDPNIDFYLGEAKRCDGDHETALACFEAAEEKSLRHPDFFLRKGMTHSSLGQLGKARDAYSAALDLRPAFVEAMCNLANVEAKLGDIEHAIELYEQVLDRAPEFAPAITNLGLMYFTARRWHEAARHLQQAAAYDPNDANVAEKLAIALGETEQVAEAVARYRGILDRDPANAVAMTNLGNLLYNVGRTEEALVLFKALADRVPESAVYRLHVGIALYSLDRHAKAHEVFDQVRELAPACPMARRAGIETVVGRADLYDGMSRLLQGDLANGWDLYENRWHAKERRPIEVVNAPGAVWKGEDVAGRRLFILREQGIGDEIMFASMFREAIARAGHCIIQCNLRLQGAFERSFPQAEIRPATESHADWVDLCGEIRDGDYHIFMGSLPRVLRRDRQSFPRQPGYLRGDDARRRYWRERLDATGADLKVGLSWQGGTLNNGARFRSMALEELRPLLALDGIVPVSLQYTDCADDIARFQAAHGIRIHHWSEAIDDYNETINLVAELDLVISVQTAIVHTAGALGCETWVLLPRAQTNWRWFGHGEDCAWYPNTRLWHQDEPGDWAPLVERAVATLKQRL